MKNKSFGPNTLGVALALVTAGIVIFSFVYLTARRPGNRPFFRACVIGRGSDLRKEREAGTWRGIEEERNIEGDFDTLLVKNISGSIRIRAWTRDYSNVHYTKRGPFAEELKIITELDNNNLSVHPEHTPKRGKPFATVSFVITVPKEVSSLVAESTSGSIEVSGMGPQVDQNLRTISGRIETDNARNLSAGTTSGSIRFRFSGSELQAKTVSGSISGEILGIASGGSCDLTSVSGSVTLRAFDDLGARVSMKSTSGAVSCEFPLQTTVSRKSELSGTVGDGASSISIRTTSGSIRLKKL